MIGAVRFSPMLKLSQKALNSLEEKGGPLSALTSLATSKVENQLFSYLIMSSAVVLVIL